MHPVKTLALGSSLALVLSGAALAQSQPSSPAEKAQTQQLNQNITDANTAVDAKTDQDSALYQEQQKRYQAQKRDYDAQASRYEAERDRYAAERARYHRGIWPAHYEHSVFAGKGELLGAPVKTYLGLTVGHVEELALSPGGHVDALRVTLDHGNGNAWIGSDDLRFDADERVVMTDLDVADLDAIARETY